MPSLSQSTLVHQWKTDHSVAHSILETESICQYTISLRMDKMIFSRLKIIISTLVLVIALVISVSAQEICTQTVHEGKAKILCGRSIAIQHNNKDEGDSRMRAAQPQEIQQSQPVTPQQYHRETIQPRPVFQPIMTILGKPLMRQMETFDHTNAIQPSEKFEPRSLMPEQFERTNLIQPNEKFEPRSLMPEQHERTNLIQPNENFEHKKIIEPTEKFEYRGVMQPPPMYEIPKVIHANENFQHRSLMEPKEQFEQRKIIHNQPKENYQPTMLMQPSEKFETKLLHPNENYQHTMLMQPSEKYETRKLLPPNENFQQRNLIQPNENFHHRSLMEPMEKHSSRKNSQSKQNGRQSQRIQPRQMSQATDNIEQRQIILPWQPSQRIPSVPAPEPVPHNNQISSSSSNTALNTIESSSSSHSQAPQKFSDTRDMQTQESKKSKKWSFFKRLNNKWASGFRRKTKAILGAPRYIAAVYHKKVGEFLGVGWGWTPKKVKVVKHVGWSKPKDKGPIIWVSGKGHDSHHGWSSSHKPKYEKTVHYNEQPVYHYDHHDNHDHHGQHHQDVHSYPMHGWSSEAQSDRKSENHYITEPEATVPRSKSPILALTVKMQLPDASDLLEHNSVMKKSDDRDEGKKRKPIHLKKLTLAPLEHYRKKVKTSIKPVYL